MSRLRAEPPSITTLPELLATAAAMEREAIAGYTDLAARMRGHGRMELAAVFERLIAEETDHLAQVEDWSAAADIGHQSAVIQSAVIAGAEMFDDEDSGAIAPELITTYRAFSMAVRNEERAFIFWSYVAAHAPTPEVRLAAERMAREELAHVATLRKERRCAFHEIRSRNADSGAFDLAALEQRLATLFDQHGAALQRPERASLAREAGTRSRDLEANPFTLSTLPGLAGIADPRHVGPLCELLLDAYLHLAEHARPEQDRDRAQRYAAQLVQALNEARRTL